MPRSLILAAIISRAVPASAGADVDSYHVHSLEWLVDASDSVQLVKVAREKHPVSGVGTTRVTSVDHVLKAVGDRALPNTEELSSAVLAPGEHRAILFLQKVPKKATPEVLSIVYLDSHKLPDAPDERAALLRSVIPEGFERPRPTESSRCVAIDRQGRIVTDPDTVVKIVVKRAGENPRRVTTEGFWALRGEALEDQNSVYWVFAPFDADERDGFLKQIRSGSGVERATAASRLVHYPDAEVIAELKKCLTDDYHNSQHVEDEPGGPPRSAEVYVVRRAAYESLRKLKVEAAKPELEHRR